MFVYSDYVRARVYTCLDVLAVSIRETRGCSSEGLKTTILTLLKSGNINDTRGVDGKDPCGTHPARIMMIDMDRYYLSRARSQRRDDTPRNFVIKFARIKRAGPCIRERVLFFFF